MSQLVAQKPREYRDLRAQTAPPVVQPLLPALLGDREAQGQGWAPGLVRREKDGTAQPPARMALPRGFCTGLLHMSFEERALSQKEVGGPLC